MGKSRCNPYALARRRGSESGAVQVYDPAADRRGEFLTEDELKVFVEAFTGSGFTAFLTSFSA